MISHKHKIQAGQNCLIHQGLHVAREGRAQRDLASRDVPFALYTQLLDGRREVKPPCAAR
jgi:hypothetical protein